MSNPEHLPSSGEHLESAGDAARERQAELLRSPEARAESPERNAEAADNALREAKEVSISVERPGHETGQNASDTHQIRPIANRKSREKAYKDILQHTQNELTPASRRFSKVIHQPIVEKASGAVGATVARPNAILFGALFAFVLSGGVYAIARYYGYTLSGFEAIGSFIIGWAFGIIVDIVIAALRKR